MTSPFGLSPRGDARGGRGRHAHDGAGTRAAVGRELAADVDHPAARPAASRCVSAGPSISFESKVSPCHERPVRNLPGARGGAAGRRPRAGAGSPSRLGLDLVGIQDHPYQRRFLDTCTLIAYAGRAAPSACASSPTSPTCRCAIRRCSPRRPPRWTVLSGGRFELGLGAGAFWEAHRGVGRRGAAAGPRVGRRARGGDRRSCAACWAASGRHRASRASTTGVQGAQVRACRPRTDIGHLARRLRAADDADRRPARGRLGAEPAAAAARGGAGRAMDAIDEAARARRPRPGSTSGGSPTSAG